MKVTCPECGHEFEAEAGSVTCPECGNEFTVEEESGDGARSTDDDDDDDDDGTDGGNGADGNRKRKRSNPPANPPAPKAVDIAGIRSAASEKEKKRLNAILLSSRAAKLEDSVAIELYNSGRTLDECRHEIIVKAAGSQRKLDGAHGVQVGKEGIEKKRELAQNAILSRTLPANFKLEKDNYFRGMTLIEIAKELYTERGISTKGKSKLEIADMVFGKRAHSTSDFPILFESAMNKTLRGDYEFAPEYWAQIARQTSVSDFRSKNFYQVESNNGMHETAEGGEIKYTTLTEAKQSIRVKKYAEGIKFTREAFINDDLNALALIPNRFVKDWDELRGDLVWGMIVDNVAVDDGKKLFSAEHKNLLSGATSALSEEGLEASLLAFRTQVALGGKRRIRVQPKTIIVPPQLEVKAKKLLTAIQASNTADVNVFSGAYDIIVEPRLTEPKAWYLNADPNATDGLYYAYLDGNDGLRVNSEDDFNTDTMKYAVRGEFGVAAVDYRGWVKMAGQ